MAEQHNYPIVEIFESLQGEGFNTGKPCTFIRFGKCNLNCPWCDTNFSEYQQMDAEAIIEQISRFQSKNIIITGGEPTIQPDLPLLLSRLKSLGYYLMIETNGLLPVPELIDYTAASPKRIYQRLYRSKHISHADEVRIVVDDPNDTFQFCEFIEQLIPSTRYYLSPCEKDGAFNLLETITLLGKLNSRAGRQKPWGLSIQCHKLVSIH